MITRIILALLLKLDQLGLLDVAKAIVIERTNALLWDAATQLVAWADELDLPGEDKMRAVIEALMDQTGPYYTAARDLPLSTIRWAVETAVERMQASR
jgi:hypothetical protein